jgi:hypothetical protein
MIYNFTKITLISAILCEFLQSVNCAKMIFTFERSLINFDLFYKYFDNFKCLGSFKRVLNIPIGSQVLKCPQITFTYMSHSRQYRGANTIQTYIIYIGRSRNSSVVYRWATGWMIGGSSPGSGWEFFSSPPRPDRLWGPPSLLPNGYQGLFSGG